MKIIKNKDELQGFTNSTLGMRKQKTIPLKNVSEISDEVNENMQLLEDCRRFWDSLRDFRTRRLRNRKYYRGDQWSDQIEDPDNEGEYITEETYLKNQGKVPLKQNQIRQLVKNLIGQYRSNPSKSIVVARAREDAQATEMLSNALQAAEHNNMLSELDARIFEEFNLSGSILQKIGYKYFKERNLEDLYVENVNPNRIFFNSDVADIRLHDLRLIGEIIDTTVDDIVSVFAKSKADEEKIRELYAGLVDRTYLSDHGLDATRLDNMDFFNPRDSNKARLFEIWRLRGEWRIYAHDPMDGSYNIVPYSLKEISEQNRERVRLGTEQGIPQEEIPLIEAEEKYEQFWYVKFLTPFGHCLYEGETPYKHEEHPYAITLYPLLDGEVWGFVEDIIDQQRYINRLIIQMDFIMSASAKGVLMIPEDIIPDGMTPNDFAREWTRFNGVITYVPKAHGKIPEQISANSTGIGLNEMIALEMNIIQGISGVHDAIQGKSAVSGKPAALYAQEAQNASLNTLDYMSTFRYYKQKRDMKALKVIVQYYNEKRYLAVNGRTINEDTKLYDPELVRDLDFDVVVTQGMDTPVYRQLIDETLFKLLEGQLIDLEMFLEHTSLPFADKLLAAVRQRKEAMAQGGLPGGMPEELLSQISGSVDPKAMALAKQSIGMKPTI